MLVAPTLLVGASLVAVAVAIVVEVVVLATVGLLGAVGDEVVRIAAVVAPGVLPPLPIVVDTLELVDEEAQVVVPSVSNCSSVTEGKEAREKPRAELALELDPPEPVTRAMLLEGGAPLSLARV